MVSSVQYMARTSRPTMAKGVRNRQLSKDMSMSKPVEIRKVGDEGLEIAWDDGRTSQLSSRVLRENCPSAVSRAKRGDTSHDKPLSGARKSSLLKVVEHTREEELRLVKIWGVGNYALGMEWGDGHASGIYPFTLLEELSKRGE